MLLSAIYEPNNFPRLVKTGGIVFMTFPLHTNVVVVTANNDTFTTTVKGVVPCVLDTLTMKHIEITHHSLLTIYSTMAWPYVKEIQIKKHKKRHPRRSAFLIAIISKRY
tara:strand:+ start:1343 stop:1669 length:327 start_codon:yes stop_codon:yes gene_type:complete